MELYSSKIKDFLYFRRNSESPVNFICYYIAIFFSKIFIYLSKKCSSFNIKCMHLLVLSKFLLYILISGKNMYKGLFFIIFVTNEIFKILFTKRKHFDTAILLISMSFIEIGVSYWWNLYSSISVSSNLIYLFIHFHIWFYIFT